MHVRNITVDMVELTLESPDAMSSAREGSIVYNKVINGKLIRVVTTMNKLITVYATTKISKYLKE